MQLYELNHNLPLASLHVVKIGLLHIRWRAGHVKYSLTMFLMWFPIGDKAKEDVTGDFYKDEIRGDALLFVDYLCKCTSEFLLLFYFFQRCKVHMT
jgi:hypothetical protein